jgi:hypothetical protein
MHLYYTRINDKPFDDIMNCLFSSVILARTVLLERLWFNKYFNTERIILFCEVMK